MSGPGHGSCVGGVDQAARALWAARHDRGEDNLRGIEANDLVPILQEDREVVVEKEEDRWSKPLRVEVVKWVTDAEKNR